MRPLILAAAASAALLIASSSVAAPVCETRHGDGARCGTPGAMPVGWSLPARERAYWRPDTPIPASEWFGLASLIGGFVALVLLMPKFDGARGEDWDEQEDDKRGRRR